MDVTGNKSDNENHTENDVLRAVNETLAGNTDAYTVIVKKYMKRLYYTALNVCGCSADAEDLVQETLITGYLQLSSLREREKLEGWLMRILKNKAFNHLARKGRMIPADELPDVGDVTDSPEYIYIIRENIREMRNSLENLSPALRETAVLYFWYDLPIKTISKRLNLSEGTVKRRIHDAREKLKKESYMRDNSVISEDFAEKVAAKIKELENYTNTYNGTKLFDSAYSELKELIGGLSDGKTVSKYSAKVANIAIRTDMDRYFDEAMATYRKYNESQLAAHLFLKKCWKLGTNAERAEYTKNTVLPALEEYFDGEGKQWSVGYHSFWMSYYVDKSTPEGLAEAKKWLDASMEAYKNTTKPDASYANAVAGLKAIEEMNKDKTLSYACVTGEKYKITEGNLMFEDQPGCCYSSDGNLAKFQNYIFYNAGSSGDGYFFPRTIPLEAGRNEVMDSGNGKADGVRRVVAISDTVDTPAGLFEGCVHIEKTDGDGNRFDIWYKDGVGLVKIVNCSDQLTAKVLCSYEIKGGKGLFPLAIGNRWNYEGIAKPDFLYERNEYVVERMDDEYVCLSALNYFACEKDWDKNTEDPYLLFFAISELCRKKQYDGALDLLKKIVLLNKNRELVDIALASIDYFKEKKGYDAQNWRFCPSSVNISEVEVKKGKYHYRESSIEYLDTGVWGSRGEENRIFGVKPFRYLRTLCHTLWDDKWVPGYTDRYSNGWKKGDINLQVDEGGTVDTPCGTFSDTVRITVEYETDGNPDNYSYYFYENPECGKKEFWFAKGVGIVRLKCTWGKHLESDCLLTKYSTVAEENEMMPIHIGNSWTYEEKHLTAENYIARRDYRVISGKGGKYILSDNQMFTWRGNKDEYTAWKKTLKN